EVEATGGDKAAGELDKVDQAAGRLSKRAGETGTAWQRAGKSIVEGLQGVASDLIRVSTALGALDFAKAGGEARRYEDATTRMALATGNSLDSVQKRLLSIAKDTAIDERSVNAWAVSLTKTTYSYDKALASAKAFAAEALASGRTLEDYAPLA